MAGVACRGLWCKSRGRFFSVYGGGGEYGGFHFKTMSKGGGGGKVKFDKEHNSQCIPQPSGLPSIYSYFSKGAFPRGTVRMKTAV